MMNKKPIPIFIGPSYEAKSRRLNSMRSINLYPELAEVPGKGQSIEALYSRPGLEAVNTLGNGPIRGCYTLSNSTQSFIVSGAAVFIISSVQGPPVLVAGNLLTDSGPVEMTNNGTHLIIVDGSFGYTIELANPVIQQIVDDNFFNGSKTVQYLGGYFILDKPNSSFFYISDLDSTDFPPLNEQFAGASEDDVTGVMVNNEQLYVMGARTIETWILTGGSASAPFNRVRTYNVGCSAPYTLRRISGTFCWLGTTEQGDGIVYSMENDTPTRISNHAIEYKIQEFGDLTSATGFALQHNGHHWYLLNLPGADTTLVYDFSTKQWHEWMSLTNGIENRCFGEFHCFLAGEHVLGDYRNGTIYRLNDNYFKDGPEPLRRIRQSPPVSEIQNNLFVHLFELDLEVGVGLNTGEPNEVNPKIVLSISRDGGYTWGSSPRTKSAGKIGKYLTRVRFHQLGMARDFVFRVQCDDPVNITLLRAYLDLEVGMS
jgi:hypothetical protein